MGLFCNDLVEKEDCSNLELLANISTSQSPRNIQVSEEEEEEKVDISFLDRVPRKRRSSLTELAHKTLPFWLEQVMEKLEEVSDPKLIFEKTIYQTDIEPGEGRLSLPSKKLIRSDFLRPDESRMIEQDINNNEKIGVRAIVVDQRSQKWEVMLKRWELKKRSGNGSWSYVLTVGWNKIVKAKGLKVGDRFSIWCLRWSGILCFALVPPHPSSWNDVKEIKEQESGLVAEYDEELREEYVAEFGEEALEVFTGPMTRSKMKKLRVMKHTRKRLEEHTTQLEVEEEDHSIINCIETQHNGAQSRTLFPESGFNSIGFQDQVLTRQHIPDLNMKYEEECEGEYISE